MKLRNTSEQLILTIHASSVISQINQLFEQLPHVSTRFASPLQPRVLKLIPIPALGHNLQQPRKLISNQLLANPPIKPSYLFQMGLKPQTALEWSLEGTNVRTVEDRQHVVDNPVVLLELKMKGNDDSLTDDKTCPFISGSYPIELIGWQGTRAYDGH